MLEHLARAARSFQDFGSWIAYETMNRTAELRPGGCWHRDALALLCVSVRAVMQEPTESVLVERRDFSITAIRKDGLNDQKDLASPSEFIYRPVNSYNYTIN